MSKLFAEQKTPDAKYSTRYAVSYTLRIPAENIDLYDWITRMTDDDYTSYSKAHQAMSSFYRDGVFNMTNVENIGIETLVQHYELRYHSRGHVQFYSSRSKAYIMRWFPATIGVPWELCIQPISDTSCRLVCMIGVDFPGFALKTASWLTSLGGMFLQHHLAEEARAFASDIETKFMTCSPAPN